MDDKLAVSKYLEDLFRYLDTFEQNVGQFETEAFLQTYNGIGAVFQALRQQRDQAVEVDRFLLDRLKEGPLNASDLRLVTLQILVTFFEVEADIDGRSNKAFSYCRGLRAVKQDVPYFEEHLLPQLFRAGALNGDFRLHSFLLTELARYLNLYGKPIEPHLAPEAFMAMSEPMQLLQLQRRRLQLGSGLINDSTSLEFHLARVEQFRKMATRGSVTEKYLKQWQYVTESSFWKRVREALSETGGKSKGALSNWRYLRLVLSQRNPAYAFYGFVIVLFLFLAYFVPSRWAAYEEQRLEKFQQRVHELPRPDASEEGE